MRYGRNGKPVGLTAREWGEWADWMLTHPDGVTVGMTVFDEWGSEQGTVEERALFAYLIAAAGTINVLIPLTER